MRTVRFDLAEDVVAREMIILGLYRRGAISRDRAAELVSIDRTAQDWTGDCAGAAAAPSPWRSVD